MAKIRFILDRHKPNKTGTFPVRLVFGSNSKEAALNMGIYADIEDWDEENQLVLSSDPKFKRKNLLLQEKYDEAERFLEDIERKGRLPVDPKKIRDMFAQKDKAITFMDYFLQFTNTKSGRTKELYTTTYNKIKSIFGTDIYFSDINSSWLQKFEQKCNNKTNSIGIHLRNIRTVFNFAIDNEIISADLYPFRRFKIKKEETAHRNISVEKLRKLFAYSGTDSENLARDVAKLMFYLIGINASDLYDLEKPVDGRINYRRNKTGRLYSIKLEPEAMELLERFKGKNHFLCFQEQFSDCNNFLKKINGKTVIRKMNEKQYLKRGLNSIGDAIGIDGLTSYFMRHTWATVASELEIPKETISEALGHSIGSGITAIYINFDRKKVDDANRKVIDFVNTATISDHFV